MGVMKNQDLDFLHFMDGAMDLYDDLPDGAWWAVGEEMVELFNAEYKRNIDPNDGFHYYIQARGKHYEKKP